MKKESVFLASSVAFLAHLSQSIRFWPDWIGTLAIMNDGNIKLPLTFDNGKHFKFLNLFSHV